MPDKAILSEPWVPTCAQRCLTLERRELPLFLSPSSPFLSSISSLPEIKMLLGHSKWCGWWEERAETFPHMGIIQGKSDNYLLFLSLSFPQSRVGKGGW